MHKYVYIQDVYINACVSLSRTLVLVYQGRIHKCVYIQDVYINACILRTHS